MSSAIISIRMWTFKGKSLMNNTKSKGPNMEPCVTPAVTVLRSPNGGCLSFEGKPVEYDRLDAT